QLILFRFSNQLVVAFKHLQKPRDSQTDSDSYEDSTDDAQAIYTHGDLLEYLAFVLEKYLAVPNKSLGGYACSGTGGGPGLRLCQRFFHRGDIDPGNDILDIDPSV
ncbi:MCLN1 protein, partial [Sylvietta virens]|nr:MCLN1 protein [Sylvietta virens]